MIHRLDRREFVRRVLALSAAGATWSLAGCSSRPAPATPTASAPQARDLPPTATAAPTRIPTAVPTSTSGATATTAQNPTRPPSPEPTVTSAPTATSAPAAAADLAVAHGANADPVELTRRAIAAIGGIERFVKPGANVIIKPNICNAYHGPEYASTTNPDVIGALIALCLGAGASRVRVMDLPFAGTPQAAYTVSGIAAAVKAAGGEMEVMNRLKYRKTSIPQGRVLKTSNVYGEILDADVVINVPIPKDHGSTGLTLGMKNLMGVVQDRNMLHARGLHQCIADLNTTIRPQLTVMDAVRILMANGPTGGNLDDVKKLDTVIASADVVAADAYATTFFGMTGKDIDYIRLGAEMGVGTMDLAAIKIEEITV